MTNTIIYCKSFCRDVDRVKILLNSIEKYNVNNIPFYISVPTSDKQLFENRLGTKNYTLLFDEDILGSNIEQNWKTQQLVKMLFWKLDISPNTFVVDSDAYFIKDFYFKDFMVDKLTPYTVCHEQHELFSWFSMNKRHFNFNPVESFRKDRQIVMDVFDRKGKYYDFGPSPVIWNKRVWESLETNYTVPNKLTYTDLLKKSPSEFSWYGETLLALRPIELYPIEPLFLVFHYKQQWEEYKSKNITIDLISETKFGIVMQSSSNLPLLY